MQSQGILTRNMPERQSSIKEVRSTAYTHIMYREGRPASMRTKQISSHLNLGPASHLHLTAFGIDPRLRVDVCPKPNKPGLAYHCCRSAPDDVDGHSIIARMTSPLIDGRVAGKTVNVQEAQCDGFSHAE